MGTQDDSTNQEATSATLSILVRTLSWKGDAADSFWPKDRLVALAAESSIWQSASHSGSWAVAIAMLNGFSQASRGKKMPSGVEAERINEILGLMGAIGEQASLAWTSYQDTQRLVETLAERTPEHQKIVVRAMSETCSHFTLGAGHSLGNLVLRVLLLNADAGAYLNDKYKKAHGFQPHVSTLNNWATFNRKLVDNLVAAADLSSNSAMVTLANVTKDFQASPEFQALDTRRGLDYHRRRPQSLAHSSSSKGLVEIENGRSMMAVGSPVPDPDADAAVVFATVQAALAPVAQVMCEIASSIGDAIRGENFVFNSDSDWAARRKEMIDVWGREDDGT